ncbi:DUF427 domain-containing protein [Dokdonella sp.]|uniref:DUF427 domain-containing protein n=1 Tax=Dokdonella sp. TaxID=2291710 RepID=UPI003C4E966A
MKAIWNDQVLAASDDTVVVENNHYDPPDSLNREFFAGSATRAHCPWKGEAHYFSLRVDGKKNRDAAWLYPSPKGAAKEFAGGIVFWKGVSVVR